MRPFILSICSLLTTAIFAVSIASAQEATPITTIDATEIKGSVIQVEKDRLTLRTEQNEIKEFDVNENVQIERNKNTVNLVGILPGDRAIVTVRSSGEVLSIDASVGEDVPIIKWIAVSAALVAVVTLLGFLVWRTKHQTKMPTVLNR